LELAVKVTGVKDATHWKRHPRAGLSLT